MMLTQRSSLIYLLRWQFVLLHLLGGLLMLLESCHCGRTTEHQGWFLEQAASNLRLLLD